MTIEEYQTLSGLTVSDTTRVSAVISRTKSIIETLLGIKLDETLVDENEYVEIGKTLTDCPCVDSVDITALDAPDAVVFAYRMFNFNKKDKLLAIDPCSDVHAVKLVKDGVTFLTLDEEDYRLVYKNGIIKYIELCDGCFCNSVLNCECNQLAVDATWLWDDDDDIPSDLKYVWSDMITYYSDSTLNIKSETLGTHSYSKTDVIKPQDLKENVSVLKKYCGPRGSLYRTYTA